MIVSEKNRNVILSESESLLLDQLAELGAKYALVPRESSNLSIFMSVKILETLEFGTENAICTLQGTDAMLFYAIFGNNVVYEVNQTNLKEDFRLFAIYDIEEINAKFNLKYDN